MARPAKRPGALPHSAINTLMNNNKNIEFDVLFNTRLTGALMSQAHGVQERPYLFSGWY